MTTGWQQAGNRLATAWQQVGSRFGVGWWQQVSHTLAKSSQQLRKSWHRLRWGTILGTRGTRPRCVTARGSRLDAHMAGRRLDQSRSPRAIGCPLPESDSRQATRPVLAAGWGRMLWHAFPDHIARRFLRWTILTERLINRAQHAARMLLRSVRRGLPRGTVGRSVLEAVTLEDRVNFFHMTPACDSPSSSCSDISL